MRNRERIRAFAVRHYSVFILLVICCLLSLVFVAFGKELYATINDNLDSNIVQYKMAKASSAFGDSTIELPFLGGNSHLCVRFSLHSLPYYFFSPILAYYLCFITKVLLSGLGFFFLAREMNKYETFKLDQNIFCLCGIVYGLLGTWPSAAFGFALLPWWILVFYLLYRTRKIVYILLPIIFISEISLPLIGIFALSYTFLAFLVLCVKDKRIHMRFLLGIIVLGLAYYFYNKGQITAGTSGNAETIKSLGSVNYTDSIRTSISVFFEKFIFERLYHSGGADLRFFVIPVCSLFFFLHVYRLFRSKVKERKTISIIYVLLYLAIILNTLACCFDNNYRFRSIISFASGFSFSRFVWLSPCIWMILFALVCCEIKYPILKYGSILVAFLMVVFCLGYTQINSMYNELYYNISSVIGEEYFPEGTQVWTWKEYYSETLFDKIKKDISYEGEWAVAYGLDCAVLQYNGVKTLDGYYSNYSLTYHDVFERMIQPELEICERDRLYWEKSYGIRAYLYSPSWEFLMPKNSDIVEDYLYFDSEVFYNELGGKYIFSRVIISNAEDLGLTLEGKWSDEESPYTIYLYSIDEEGVARAKARKAYRRWDAALPSIKNYDVTNLCHNDDVLTDSNYFVLEPGGIVYGPAEPIKIGAYSISFFGNNLDECTCDAFANSNWYAVQFNEEYRNSNEIRLTLYIIEPVQDIEFRVFNNSENVAQLYRVSVECIDEKVPLSIVSEMDKTSVETAPDSIDRFRMCNGQGSVIDDVDDVKIFIVKRNPGEITIRGYDSKIPLDYRGIASGEEVCICTGAMNKLPEQYRAKSLDEATFLVIVESEYYFSGQLADEAMISDGRGEYPVVKYYPTYDIISYFNIYNVKTGLYETRGFKRTAPNFWPNSDDVNEQCLALLDNEWADEQITQFIEIISE